MAYGADPMLEETRQRLLQAQMHNGLRDEIIRSSTVSGLLDYPSLVIAAKHEEQRLAELKRRQQYRAPVQSRDNSQPAHTHRTSSGPSDSKPKKAGGCFNCGKTGHFQRDCPHPLAQAESHGSQAGTKSRTSDRTVSVKEDEDQNWGDPLDFLYSDSDDQTCLIRVED